MAPNARLHKAVNIWSARFVPLILFGLIGYSTWVLVDLIAIQYLLKQTHDVQPRTAAGIAILVIYFLVLIPFLLSFLRLVQVVLTNPGLVPVNAYDPVLDEKTDDNSDAAPTPSQNVGYLDRMSVFGGRTSAPPGLPQFYNRDVFECELDGLPRWCSMCRTWKPDRSHHCSELGRCVYKMDHFCPWAGGIVSETNFKFFIQMCIYASFYCTFTLVVAAYYTAKRSEEEGIRNANWIVVIVVSALFAVFASSIGVNSLRFAFINSTTVDSLTRRTRVYHFAILIPTSSQPPGSATTPEDGMNNSQLPPQAPPHPGYTTITYPLPNSQIDQNPRNQSPRTFAVLPTIPGTNPYHLSSFAENFKTVMGEHWYDWLLPIKYSPSWTQSNDCRGLECPPSGKTMYQFGPVIDRMRRDAGISPPISQDASDRGPPSQETRRQQESK